jgi:hypothetical protein
MMQEHSIVLNRLLLVLDLLPVELKRFMAVQISKENLFTRLLLGAFLDFGSRSLIERRFKPNTYANLTN